MCLAGQDSVVGVVPGLFDGLAAAHNTVVTQQHHLHTKTQADDYFKASWGVTLCQTRLSYTTNA